MILELLKYLKRRFFMPSPAGSSLLWINGEAVILIHAVAAASAQTTPDGNPTVWDVKARMCGDTWLVLETDFVGTKLAAEARVKYWVDIMSAHSRGNTFHPIPEQVVA